MQSFLLCAICVGGFVVLPLTARAVDAPGKPVVVVSTSLLETAVRDVLGPEAKVIRLMPPGSCPGHFDLSPGQVRAMKDADVFVRHDYQGGLDEGVLKSGIDRGKVLAATSYNSFVIPDHYVALCRELVERFAVEWPDDAQAMLDRLEQVEQRASQESARAQEQLKRLRDRRVLAAAYQKDFCEWAGLRVVAVFHAGADGSAWLLSRAVEMARTAEAEAVIGNRQWGERHLASLTEATRLPGIMCSNFPASGAERAYWAFFRDNVDALCKGLP